MKIAVVYWSSTGKTEAMAQAVVEGAKHAGAEAELFTAAEFDGGKMDEFDAVAFGCPPWARRNWKTANLPPCSRPARVSSPARRSPCSALMAGGRRRVDAHVGRELPGQGRKSGLRQRDRRQETPR